MSRAATEFPIWLFGTSTNEGAEPIVFNRAMADKIVAALLDGTHPGMKP